MVEGFKNTVIGAMPNDWNDIPLGKYAKLINGRAYSLFEWESRGTPVIRLQNLTGRGEKYYFSNLKLPEKQYCNYGDLLFMWSATFGPVIWKGEKAIFHYHIWKIETVEDNLDSSFLYHILEELTERVKKNSTNGGTMLHLTKGGMEVMPIPLPPTKAEQTAIATALNDTDNLITHLEKLIAKKQMIKQGAMQELLRPKEGWKTKKLKELSSIRRGASPRPIKDPRWFSDNGRGWIRISDVTSSKVYLNQTTQYLSDDGVRNSVTVDKGDLIMSICATIGVPIIINIPACIHDGFVLFRNYENTLDTFFLYFILQAKTEDLISKGQPGTQMNLNTSIVGDIIVDFPNIEEQNKIGSILKDMDIEIAGLEKKLEKYKMLKQGMMQNLLTGKIRLV